MRRMVISCALALVALSWTSLPAATAKSAGGAPKAAAGPNKTLGAGESVLTLESGGKTRTCVVHLPKGFDDKQPIPVVISYHGAGGTGIGFIPTFRHAADKYHFIVACPDGIVGKSHVWNSLLGHGDAGGQNAQGVGADDVDDVAYTRDLLKALRAKYNTNPARQYVCGFSSGAYMASRAAVDLSDEFAAATIVCGSLGTRLNADGKLTIENPAPALPISVLTFYCKKDGLIKWDGAITKLGVIKSIPDCVKTFAKADGCATPVTETRDAKKGVERTIYMGGKAGTEVKLVIVENLNHSWPQLKDGVDANEEMWDFFSKHPKLAPEPGKFATP